MGIIYSYLFPKKDEYDYTTNIDFDYSIYYDDRLPLTSENLILNDIECAENLKQLRIGFVNQNFSNNSGKP